MMKETTQNKTKWLHLRLSTAEYEQLQKLYRKSTCQKMSDFARKNLLQKPVVLKYRNESLDEIMAELILLRKELNAIGNNFNQSVKKLHTLRQILEFKNWITVYEFEKKTLFNTMDNIKKIIENLSLKWLQS